MKLLILGAGGQLGTELQRLSWPEGYDIVARDRDDFDLGNRDAVFAAIAREAPDIVVNAAAYTAVDRAESEADAAYAINRDGPQFLAEACRAAGIPLIHVSTDYVYDGSQTAPYREDDPVNPLGVYGTSKAAGDQAVRDALDRHVILRTAWLYSAHGGNFVKTMLRLAGTHPRLRVVADQIGSPTSAADLAAAIGAIVVRIAAGEGRWGTYHFVNHGAVSWHGFAEAIVTLAAPWRGKAPPVDPITTADYPTPAKRPASSVLDCSKIAADYGVHPRPWRDALSEVLDELSGTA